MTGTNSHPETWAGRMSRAPRRRRVELVLGACAAVACLMICACTPGDSRGGRDEIAVTLITKDNSNPFSIAMQEGAKQAAIEEDVKLTIGAGKFDGDDQGQVPHIENAISEGHRGILVAANGSAVNASIKRARDAGLFVIALDTPTEPANVVDLTVASDNFKAGELIGHWAAETLAGQPARLAMLNAANNKIMNVDVQRGQGFLTGMGIEANNTETIGDEPPTGSYQGGGAYELVCHEATHGSLNGGRIAMENCLTKNPGVNLVYAVNELAAEGAHQALQAADTAGATIVSVGGGCEPGIRLVKEGVIGATSQQYPLRMASEAVRTIAEYVRNDATPTIAKGRGFLATPVALVTDNPVPNVESITSTQADEVCWG
jgi:fructose transport system substrate-binding protein